MSFTQNNLSKSSTGYAHIVSGQEWIYTSPNDTLTEIKAPGYFDIIVQLFRVGEVLNIGDVNGARDLIEISEIQPTAPRVRTKDFSKGAGVGTLIHLAVVNSVGAVVTDNFNVLDIVAGDLGFATMQDQGGPSGSIVSSFAIPGFMEIHYDFITTVTTQVLLTVYRPD